MGQTLVSADEQTTSNDVKILNPFEDVGGYHDDSVIPDTLLQKSAKLVMIFFSHFLVKNKSFLNRDNSLSFQEGVMTCVPHIFIFKINVYIHQN
jgi:hypothetical protein